MNAKTVKDTEISMISLKDLGGSECGIFQQCQSNSKKKLRLESLARFETK
jgi:hypothetical protein